jgi:predicted porin
MKKSLIALALAGVFVSAAQAQSVELYGIVDMGFVQERGGSAGNVSKLTSGAQSGTRIGFRGTEDLGNNMKALFVLETGIAADQGGFNQPAATPPNLGTGFARQSFVGLQSDMGTLTLGRQYTPYFLTMLVGDPFAAGMAGAAQNMLMPGSNIRMNDTVKYTSPVFGGGFSGEVAYGFGEVAGGIGKSQQLGAFVGYSSSPVNVRLGYLKKNNATNTDDATNYMLAANWDVKVAKLFAAVTDNNETTVGRFKSQDYLIGAQIPFNKHTFIASYIYKDGGTGTAGNANQVALGYTYTISKRTNLYAAWGRINNDTGIGLRVGNNSETGSGDKAFNLGIRHIF